MLCVVIEISILPIRDGTDVDDSVTSHLFLIAPLIVKLCNSVPLSLGPAVHIPLKFLSVQLRTPGRGRRDTDQLFVADQCGDHFAFRPSTTI